MTTSWGALPAEHGAEVAELTRRLHAAGWASHVTVDDLVQSWEQLAGEVGDYVMTIDDYTNDLTARDALAQVLSWASESLGPVLDARIAAADERFRSATQEDRGRAVGRFFRINTRPGWWWRRRPASGPLRAYLDASLDD